MQIIIILIIIKILNLFQKVLSLLSLVQCSCSMLTVMLSSYYLIFVERKRVKRRTFWDKYVSFSFFAGTEYVIPNS